MKLLSEKIIRLIRDPPFIFQSKDREVFALDFEKEFLVEPVLRLKKVHTYHRTIVKLSKLKIYNSYTHYHWNYRYFFLQVYRRLFFQFLKREELVVDKAIWITDSLLGNYYHWLIDCLSRYTRVENFVAGHVVLIPEAFRYWKPIPEVMQWLNIPFTYYNSYKVYKVNELLLPGFCCKHGDHDPETVRLLSKKFLSTSGKPAYRNIYISRKKANYRFVVNESELESCLKKWNVEIHCFEDYNFETQNKLMNECKLLIGLHGAGLANMIMMPAGGEIIELKNTIEQGLNHYFNLARALEFRYNYVPASSEDQKTLNSNFKVEVPILEQVLSQIFSTVEKTV